MRKVRISMKINELRQELKNRNIPHILYRINDEDKSPNRVALDKLECGKYIVYFDSHDGKRKYEFIFDAEESACEYMLSIFDKTYLKQREAYQPNNMRG